MMRGGHLDICVLGAFQASIYGDLANWHTGAPDAIPAVGGAMDLAIGAKQVFVMMELLTKNGESKLVERCSYPLTGLRCVSRLYTDLAIFDLTAEGAIVAEMVDGHLSSSANPRRRSGGGRYSKTRPWAGASSMRSSRAATAWIRCLKRVKTSPPNLAFPGPIKMLSPCAVSSVRRPPRLMDTCARRSCRCRALNAARLALTLVHSLERSGGRIGLAALCVGVGQGLALVVEGA
jgi:hypothetical protein